VRQAGFTMVELMMVIAIAAVCFAVTVAVNPQMIRTAKTDSGLVQAMDVLRSARDMAISQRRNMAVQFTGTNIIQIFRVNDDLTQTLVRQARLENRLRFQRVGGVPDTPDKFGTISGHLSFSSTTRQFLSDGTFANNLGDPMNGTLFLAVPDEPNSARAVTFFGPTAFLRAWRWDGKKWVE
jgi:prepilin-type N-terminal cleavage/methylation domain-containing protein